MKTHNQLHSATMFVFLAGVLLTSTGYADLSGISEKATYAANTHSASTSSQSTTSHSHHHHATVKPNFASTIPATGKGVFIFDPKQLAWGAYDADGNLVRTGAGSGGSNYCRDLHRRCHTPVGTFTVYNVKGAKCKSKIFPIPHGGAPMPYCAYFRGGYAVHGSYEVRPYNASHGCIRIHPSDAAWLTQNILRPGSTVIVKPY